MNINWYCLYNFLYSKYAQGILELIKGLYSKNKPVTQDSLQNAFLHQFISKMSFPAAKISQSLYYWKQEIVVIPEIENKWNLSFFRSAIRSERGEDSEAGHSKEK